MAMISHTYNFIVIRPRTMISSSTRKALLSKVQVSSLSFRSWQLLCSNQGSTLHGSKLSTDVEQKKLPVETKGISLPSGLWMVATPIGNLSDLSLRAKFALENADWVLCEDTRRTSKLLYAIGMDKFQSRLHRADEFALSNEVNIRSWISALKAGRKLAYVTDAGTPGVSDPGSKLVQACVDKRIPVTPIPGPSAVVALLSVSGFADETAFCFRGFFPRKSKEQMNELEGMKMNRMARVTVWFESPKRIKTTMELIAEHSRDVQAKVVVAKELTKIHEKFFRGSPCEVHNQVAAEVEAQGDVGEWCIAIQLPPFGPSDEEVAEKWHSALRCLIECGVPLSEATRKVSEVFNAPKNQVYDAGLRLSRSKL